MNDAGVGMATGAATAKLDLGTGIVEALAKQLQGIITVGNARPGTSVLVVHDEAAADVIDFPTAA